VQRAKGYSAVIVNGEVTIRGKKAAPTEHWDFREIDI
jgi:hypothetical protein